MMILICALIFCSCNIGTETNEFSDEECCFENHYNVSKLIFEELTGDPNGGGGNSDKGEEMRGIWISQFDMHPIYRDGGKQRAEDDYRSLVDTMMDNLIRDGFNTVFLQVRPNGDSMYDSEYYPNSKYISGSYGGEIQYDAIKIFLEIAKKRNISVHAWINPYRLCKEEELINYDSGMLYEWYCEGIGGRIERGADGLLYLDPSYIEATELIANGAREILAKYDFDGLHIDDYFYPTEFEFEDEIEFSNSSFSDKGDFRRSNTDRTVKALYNVAHDYGKIFGVAPAGNIYSLENGWFIDIYKWLSEDGFIDYVMPQLYFGFENTTCPFERVLSDWMAASESNDVDIYVGLSAAKCELGSKGEADNYAGEAGKYEWRDNKDILGRCYDLIVEKGGGGFCIFSYASFYNPLTGEPNKYTETERIQLIDCFIT